MKLCKRCNIEHTKPGLFCSRSCGNHRVVSAETRRKISETNKGKASMNNKLTMSPEAYAIKIEKQKRTFLERYQNTPFDQLGIENKKRRVLEEQEHKCNGCGLTEWRGGKLTLELEHKDGNNKNNDRGNLECICPNCHSQTPTWRGRNLTGKKVGKDELLKAVQTHRTISDALRSVGLPTKGSSHGRASKMKKFG